MPQSMTQVSIAPNSVQNYVCLSETLKPIDYFEIQENDVVAACLPTRRSKVSSLSVVGYQKGIRSVIYQSPLDCLSSKAYTVDFSKLSFLNSSIIHLNADTGRYV